jgi:predicted nucleic acid-binding protein
MFVLETNVVSELRKVRADRVNTGVGTRAEKVPSAELFISAITLHQLARGCRSDGADAQLPTICGYHQLGIRATPAWVR